MTMIEFPPARVVWDAQAGDYSHKTRSWLARAARIAAASFEGEHSLGAVVVKSGRVLAVGANRHRQTLDTAVNGGVPRDAWSFCAEETALKQIEDGAGATLYVARVTPGGNYGLAKPCKKCRNLIKEKGISRVVYTTRDQRTGEWGLRTLVA